MASSKKKSKARNRGFANCDVQAGKRKHVFAYGKKNCREFNTIKISDVS